MAVNLSSWEPFLERNSFHMGRSVPDMYSLFRHDALRNLGLRILKMMKCLFAYFSSRGVARCPNDGRTWVLQLPAIFFSKRKRDTDIEG